MTEHSKFAQQKHGMQPSANSLIEFGLPSAGASTLSFYKKMGDYYTLVNLTKKERISFDKLPVAKMREIAGNPASAAIVAWYLLENSGDMIGFFGDDIDPPFSGVSYADICDFPDRTSDLIETLIGQEILEDCGISYQDDDNPDIYSRDIRNAWMPPDLLIPKQKPAEQATP